MSDSNTNDDAGVRFFYFGLSGLGKAVIFASTARQMQLSEERIVAVITSYYSLLHLTFALMYLCPGRLQEAQRDRLLRIAENGDDPTETISHTQAYNFLVQCRSSGLDLSNFFAEGRTLREFVNYGPRVSLTTGEPTFEHLNHSIHECDRFVARLDTAIRNAIEWAHNNSPLFLSRSAVHMISHFLEDDDLFYVEWCSPTTLAESKQFLNETLLRNSNP